MNTAARWGRLMDARRVFRNDGDNILEVHRHSTGHDTDRLKPFCLDECRLSALSLSDLTLQIGVGLGQFARTLDNQCLQFAFLGVVSFLLLFA